MNFSKLSRHYIRWLPEAGLHAYHSAHPSPPFVNCRVIVSHEAPLTSGFGAEIVATLSDRCFYSLEAPPLRITGYDTPFPLVCEPLYLPGVQRVVDGALGIVKG